MVAVERACEYTENVEGEQNAECDGPAQVPYLWPAQGVVKFSNVCMKYR